MTFSSNIRAPKSLTHPSGFRPSPQVGEGLGRAANLYAAQDQAILGHQVRLVDRAVEGSVDKDTFLRNAGHLESFQGKRAEIRGEGGVSRGEQAELNSEMKKLAGKMQALPHNQSEPAQPVDEEALGRLFDELTHGVVSKTDAVEELHWRTNQKYGEVAAERAGVIFADERPKIRAALYQGGASAPPAAPATQSSYHPGTVDLIRKGIAIFPRLDSDGNGVVDRKEARAILTNFEDLGLSPAQAATLYSRQGVLAEVDQPGPASHEMMANEDLIALLPENTGLADPRRISEAMQLVSSRLADQERRKLSPERPLHASPEGPDGSRVAQGLEGSCWFLGALPTISGDKLSEILTEEGDHYRMHFADGTSQSVAPLNEAERRVYSRGDGAWSGLMEKGVAQKLGDMGLDLKGGLTQDALALLTGAECQVVSLVNGRSIGPDYRDRENLSQLLEETLSKGGAAFTQVNSSDFDPQVSKISDAKHAYTITGYDRQSETVSLQNPWGRGEKADTDGVDDGKFQMSLTEMAANFSLVITERV